jgi:hypothetical protein
MPIALYMKHDKFQVVLYQLLYFYTSQNWGKKKKKKKTQRHISQIWTFLGHAFKTKIGVQL